MKTRLTVERGVVAFRSSRASPERGSVKARRAEGAWWVADGETEVFWEAGEPEPPAAGGAKPAGVEAEAGPQATEPVAQEPRTEGAPQVESEAPGASASPETSIPPQRNADVDNLDQPVKVEKTKRTNSP
jgi:hypothetical protein